MAVAAATTTRITMTTAEFAAFVEQDENLEKRFELIGGMVFEMPSNAYVSNIAGWILYFIRAFLIEKGIAGFVTGEGGGYQVGEGRYAPDVAYLSSATQPELARTGYNPVPPELAVEVLSSPREAAPMLIKLQNYLAVGCVVWIVDPDQQTVSVHVPGESARVYGANDSLDGTPVLRGFRLELNKVFASSAADADATADDQSAASPLQSPS